MKNKKGFTLIEFVFVLLLSGIVMGATTLIFNINLKTINIRYDKLQSNNIYKNINTLKNSIRDGHLTRYEKPIPDGVAKSNELILQTSYFSSNASKVDLLKIQCPSNNSTFYYQINNNPKTKIADNVTNCSFKYIDSVGNETNEIEKVSAIKLSFNYVTKKGNENIVIFQKMMQNS